jgi:hypothetical protein
VVRVFATVKSPSLELAEVGELADGLSSSRPIPPSGLAAKPASMASSFVLYLSLTLPQLVVFVITSTSWKQQRICHRQDCRANGFHFLQAS